MKRDVHGYFVELTDEPHLNRHRPSVDILFESISKCVGGGALGILLTGMGSDGAKGLLGMKQKGAWTIAQEESSCVGLRDAKGGCRVRCNKRNTDTRADHH